MYFIPFNNPSGSEGAYNKYKPIPVKAAKGDARTHLTDPLSGFARPGAINSATRWDNTSNLLAVARDDDFLAAFGEVEQRTRRFLDLEGTDFSHNTPSKRDDS